MLLIHHSIYTEHHYVALGLSKISYNHSNCSLKLCKVGNLARWPLSKQLLKTLELQCLRALDMTQCQLFKIQLLNITDLYYGSNNNNTLHSVTFYLRTLKLLTSPLNTPVLLIGNSVQSLEHLCERIEQKQSNSVVYWKQSDGVFCVTDTGECSCGCLSLTAGR